MTQSIIITNSYTGIGSVKLAYSTHEDMTSHTLTSVVAVTEHQLAKFPLTGLADGTEYWVQSATSAGTLFGDKGHFTTNPVGLELDMSIILTSCQGSFGGAGHYDVSEPTWRKINDLGPHQLVIQQGDFGYWGGTLHAGGNTGGHILKYQHQLSGFPRMRETFLGAPSIIQRSDHEYSPDDGDSNASGEFAPIVRTMIDAAIEMLPVDPAAWGDTRTPKQGLWFSWAPTDNVKFVVTDFRSLERSLQAMDDGPTKTAYGLTQLGWLQDELQSTHVLKIILSDVAWGPAAAWSTLTAHEKHDDKMWSYQFEQAAIANMVNNLATTDGQPINVDFWGGDRHVLGFLAEANNILGDGTVCPFDVLTASGTDKNGLYPVTGELYDEAFGFTATPGQVTNPRQFGHITLSDDGAGTITRVFDGWDCAPDPTILYTPQTYAPVKVIDGKTKQWHYDQGTYVPPTGSLLPDVTDGEDLRQHIGGDTHWNFTPGTGGGYQT